MKYQVHSSRECPVGLFCDLSRAFNCVDLKCLFLELRSYGIYGIALSWIENSLKGRKQYVNISYDSHTTYQFVKSNSVELGIGAPQGSIMGRLLFILYINKMRKFLLIS